MPRQDDDDDDEFEVVYSDMAIQHLNDKPMWIPSTLGENKTQ